LNTFYKIIYYYFNLRLSHNTDASLLEKYNEFLDKVVQFKSQCNFTLFAVLFMTIG